MERQYSYIKTEFVFSCFLENIIPRFGKYHERRPRATLQDKMFFFNFHKLVYQRFDKRFQEFD